MRNGIDRFIEEYGQAAFDFAYSLCADVEEAKELVQEAFFRAFRGKEGYDPNRRLEAWFCTILRHLYTDGLRLYETRYTVSLDQAAGDSSPLADRLPGDDQQALDILERQETARLVRRAMESLTLEQRAILSLCDLQGLSYDKIGEILDLPPGTVRSRINRSRAALRQKLLRLAGREESYVV